MLSIDKISCGPPILIADVLVGYMLVLNWYFCSQFVDLKSLCKPQLVVGTQFRF